MRLSPIHLGGVWMGFLAATAAFGQFLPIATPTPAYTGSTILVPIAAANNTLTGSVSAGGQTVTFSSALNVATVPNGWNFWGSPPATESSSPKVVFTDPNVTRITLRLSTPSNTFRFEVEPSLRGAAFPLPPTPFTMTATFMNG